MTHNTAWAKLWDDQMKNLSGLFVVSTPVGHMEDITLRALSTLRHVDGILCEDTRKSRILLHHYDIKTPFFSYHAHNEHKKLRGVLQRLLRGDRLALVSDRGTPLISDPGFLLVRECYAHKVPVHAIGGVSAVTLAVVLSGFPCQSFFFQGFLPKKKIAQRLDFLATLSDPIVFFEAPHRLATLCQQLIDRLGPHRPACLLREMTKNFEERIALSLQDLLIFVQQAKHLGECVLVVQGA